MTDQKKLKRAVRARSAKTGESYTAARRQVLQAKEKKAPAAAPPPPPQPPAAPVAQAAPSAGTEKKAAPASTSTRGQVNDASARKQTGHGLDHWFGVLDAFGGATKGHTASAAHLNKTHGIPSWHAQGITVAYERERGLREVNQSCAGDFQVSVTKTVPAKVAEVVAALVEPKRRAEWLAKADPGLKQVFEAAFTGPKPKEVKVKGSESARLRFRWGASTIEILMTGKATGTTVAVASTNLGDASEVEPRRAVWKAALEGLHRYFAS